MLEIVRSVVQSCPTLRDPIITNYLADLKKMISPIKDGQKHAWGTPTLRSAAKMGHRGTKVGRYLEGMLQKYKRLGSGDAKEAKIL